MKYEIDAVERLNEKLNAVNMENARLKNALEEDEKLNKERRVKNSNNITQWKTEIKTEKSNKLKYIKKREHIHETIKLLKPTLDRLMQLVRQYDPVGCDSMLQMNADLGKGHDRQIHTSIGFVEATIDSMLIIRAKNKQDERKQRKLDRGVTSSGGGGRVFSEKEVFHTGGSHGVGDDHHRNLHKTGISFDGGVVGSARRGGMAQKDYHIKLPTMYATSGTSNTSRLESSMEAQYRPYIEHLTEITSRKGTETSLFVTIEEFNQKAKKNVPLNMNYQIECRKNFQDNIILSRRTKKGETVRFAAYPNPKDFPMNRVNEVSANIQHAPKPQDRYQENTGNIETEHMIYEWRERHQLDVYEGDNEKSACV
jgi:hypothetical protein